MENSPLIDGCGGRTYRFNLQSTNQVLFTKLQPKLVSEETSALPNFAIAKAHTTAHYNKFRHPVDCQTKALIKRIEFNSDDQSRGNYVTGMINTVREVALLEAFDHPNIIRLHNVFRIASQADQLSELYLCLAFMNNTLEQWMNSRLVRDYDMVKSYTYQILSGLQFIHNAGVIHRNLKPSNIYINNNNDIKIGGFCMARKIANGQMTEYVAVREYRALEVILNPRVYSFSIDLWSLGCIVWEMIQSFSSQAPPSKLFYASNYIEQLKLIFRLLGPPNTDEMNALVPPAARPYVDKLLRETQYEPLWFIRSSQLQPIDSLLRRLLHYNPNDRPTAEQALEILTGRVPPHYQVSELGYDVHLEPFIARANQIEVGGAEINAVLNELRAILFERSNLLPGHVGECASQNDIPYGATWYDTNGGSPNNNNHAGYPIPNNDSNDLAMDIADFNRVNNTVNPPSPEIHQHSLETVIEAVEGMGLN